MEVSQSFKKRLEVWKSMSSFHFDPLLKDSSEITILGQFSGFNWLSEVESLLKNSDIIEDFSFLCCAKPSEEKQQVNRQFDLSFTEETSYNMDHVFLKRINSINFTRKIAPNLFKMIDWFKFDPETIDPRFHAQLPGQVFPVHVDGLNRQRLSGDLQEEMNKNPDNWARIQIQLADWTWGHMWSVGNSHWSQWRAGEIMFSPWWKYPHCTANCSFLPRYSIQVTGKLSPETRKLLGETHGEIYLQ